MRRRTFLAGATGLALAGCRPPQLSPPAGSGLRLTFRRSWSTLESAALLRLAGVEGVEPRHTVDAWSALYRSHDAAGRPIELSGLLALPRGVDPRGVVSWHHGTTTSRDAVPSNLSTDGVAAAIVFAGTGRAMIAPDYLGLGASKLTHTYLVADDTVRAIVDLLTAARALPGFPADPPFLLGFSQGGHACLAAQMALEAAGQAVKGSAAVAGPHNLRTVSLPAAMAGGSPQHALYLSYMVRGYAARYGHPLESVLTPAYATLVPSLYDQPHKPQEIIAALPADPRKLFRADFLDAFDHRGPHWLLEAIAGNEVGRFAPKAPIRLYYGSTDRDVIPREAIQTAEQLSARGGDVTATDVGPYGHDPSLLHAAPRALAWLESLEGP